MKIIPKWWNLKLKTFRCVSTELSTSFLSPCSFRTRLANQRIHCIWGFIVLSIFKADLSSVVCIMYLRKQKGRTCHYTEKWPYEYIYSHKHTHIPNIFMAKYALNFLQFLWFAFARILINFIEENAKHPQLLWEIPWNIQALIGSKESHLINLNKPAKTTFTSLHA